MRKLSIAGGMLLCCVLVTRTFSQTTNATAGGTVSDASGALIPGVAITATNTQTGIVSTGVSNEAGTYQFASLQPGTYKFSVELSGFQTQVKEIELGISQQVRLNFTLQVGSVGTELNVTAAADTLLATTSSSLGTVLPEYKVSSLPLAFRNALDLVTTTAGTTSRGGYVGAFAGNRTSAANVTLNGVVVTDGRNDTGVASVTAVSPDLVEEVRVIVSPADAEMGRGSGQVQLSTRSGTNQLRGSLFWTNQNAALSANSWLNNLNGNGKNYQNRNQYGGRLGGPIVKNKTFFFLLFEGNRSAQRAYITGQVLTAQARQGIFRYFPGAQSGNAISSNPTVDLNGNPVTPRGATGPLSSFSVFNRDPVRPGSDPSGFMSGLIAKMPLPNDFTVGDGLNTAGVRWVQHLYGFDNTGLPYTVQGADINRDQYNLRLDHNFNANNKLSMFGSYERDWFATSSSGFAAWPNGYNGLTRKVPQVFTASFVSTLSPSLLNEFRFGYRNSKTRSYTGWQRPDQPATLPRINGIPFIPRPVLFPNNVIGAGSTRGNVSPLLSYADTLSWTRAQHTFKGGAEFHFISNPSFDNYGPGLQTATFGAGGVPVTGIDGTAIPGLFGNDQATARNLLIDLAGSVQSVSDLFNIASPTDTTFRSSRDFPQVWRYWHANEFAGFFKDDWKIGPALTLNLGVRYEWYGVVYDDHGLAVAPVDGSKGLFGVSGTGFGDMYQPGRLNGSLTTMEFVGKNSPNPGKKLYNDDWNNLAPAVGVSWSLPWFGKDKTILRAGYGVSYMHTGELRNYNGIVGGAPGQSNSVTYTPATYQNLVNMTIPVPQTVAKPLQAIPVTERTQTLAAFDTNLKTPYVQNWSLEIQRELAPNLTLETRYIGSKGTKLFGAIPLNNVNIFESGILDAFNITRAGGNAPLLDQMLKGLNLGLGPVNGTTVTGSASLRSNTLTRAFLANGSVGQFANFLNTSTTVTGQGGGLIRNGGLPENLVVVNPQFAAVNLQSNPGNSTYHSMQLQLTKRLSNGITSQTSYTWSRALGENDNDANVVQYLNPRNRSLNKTLLSFQRTHDIRTNGTFDLPFGPSRTFLSNTSGWVSRLVEHWQLGGIFSWGSGTPLNITASTSSFTESTANTPMIVGKFPKNMGQVTKVANGVVYFNGLRQVADPGGAGVTTQQGLNTQFSNKAIVDANGNPVLVNPSPGSLGSLGQMWIEGPRRVGLDANLIKHLRITETKEFEVRVDALNILNHPNFGNPVSLDINNTNFGAIRSATGNRYFVLQTRLNF